MSHVQFDYIFLSHVRVKFPLFGSLGRSCESVFPWIQMNYSRACKPSHDWHKWL
jgi:hypothetical protein